MVAATALQVEAVLASLGLEKCANTRVGTPEARGLSGGERKRLSVGLELLTDFAVPPETPLDLFAAVAQHHA